MDAFTSLVWWVTYSYVPVILLNNVTSSGLGRRCALAHSPPQGPP